MVLRQITVEVSPKNSLDYSSANCIPAFDKLVKSDLNDVFAGDITKLIERVEEDISEEEFGEFGSRVADTGVIIVEGMGKQIPAAFQNVVWKLVVQPLVKTVAVCGAAIDLGIYPARVMGKFWPPFVWNTFGPENSIYFTDPYTFIHFSSGLLLYLIFGWWFTPDHFNFINSHIDSTWQDYGGLTLAILIGFVFEVGENKNEAIDGFMGIRNAFYRGDSGINVFGDVLFIAVAYNIAQMFGSVGLYWVPFVWYILSEIFTLVTFRDSGILIAIQALFPQESITAWQDEVVPEHLRGVMTAGYWKNKVRDPPEVFVDKLVQRHPSINPSSFQKLTHNQFGVSKSYWKHMTKVMESRLY